MNTVKKALTVLSLLVALTSVAMAEPIEIRIWSETGKGHVTGDILLRYIDEFNATHPDIRVVLEIGGQQQLIVAYAAGVAPDLIMQRGPAAGEIGGSGGILLPLDQFIDGPNGLPRDAFVPDLWSFSTVDGKVYQLAADSNERGLFVNRHAAEVSGIDTSQAIGDWEDLLEWARRLTRRNGDQVTAWGYDANHQLGGDRWHWVWLNDGEIFTPDGTQSLLDNPNTIEALQFAADLIHTYGVSPVPGSVGGTSRRNFLNETYNMIMTPSTFAQELEDGGQIEFLTFAGPAGVGKTGGRFSGATGSALAILDTTEHPEEAWEFVRYLMYERGLEYAADRGGIPYLMEGLQEGKYTQQPWKAFAESIINFNPRNNYNVALQESVWNGHFNTAWTSVLRGEQAPETALIAAAEMINAGLRQELGN